MYKGPTDMHHQNVINACSYISPPSKCVSFPKNKLKDVGHCLIQKLCFLCMPKEKVIKCIASGRKGKLSCLSRLGLIQLISKLKMSKKNCVLAEKTPWACFSKVPNSCHTWKAW